jgi:translation initiation factor 1
MTAKKRNNRMVYSTNPDFEPYDEHEDEPETLPPAAQILYISRDKKQRKGKQVTLVTGFVGTADDLKDLGKILKSKCGVGGSAKDGEILIQGDFREKVKAILEGLGYKCKLQGG